MKQERIKELRKLCELVEPLFDAVGAGNFECDYWDLFFQKGLNIHVQFTEDQASAIAKFVCAARTYLHDLVDDVENLQFFARRVAGKEHTPNKLREMAEEILAN